MPETVTVILPTKDRPGLLAEALQSVTDQEYSHIDVVVVNDGGVGVAPVVDKFRDRISIDLVESAVSRGPSHARNTGLDRATGDFISFLDDDDLYLPQHLSLAMRAAAEHDAQFVYCTTLLYAERVPTHQVRAEDAIAVYGFANAVELLPLTNPFPTSGVVCRSLRDTGIRFDISMLMGEDWELWLRLIHGHGFSAALQPIPTAVYFRTDATEGVTSRTTADVKAFQAIYENYLRVCERWAFPPLSVTEKLRVFMELMYVVAQRRLDRGKSVPKKAFTDLMSAFSKVLLNEISESELRREIYRALDEPAPQY
jgi:glycosyltransferase involved in cell wall biosynthesis